MPRRPPISHDPPRTTPGPVGSRAVRRERLAVGVAVCALFGLVGAPFMTSGLGESPDPGVEPAVMPHQDQAAGARATVEIRSYALRPGTGDAFHRIVVEEAVPMLQRWGVDVVAHGPSLHDPDAYYFVRAYADLDERARSHDAFYGSEEWRDGPRDRILALIESYTTVVIGLDAEGLDAFRRVR